MMPRARRVVAAVLTAVIGCTASGCFHIRASAPPLPAHVRLLPPDAPAEVSRKYQTFYYAWGLFPMSQADQVMYIIAQEHLVEARVIQGGQWQGILAGFLGAIAISGYVLPQNITIEGNRAPTLPAAAEPAKATAPPS